MKKLNFLNRIEKRIFKNAPETYTPVSSLIAFSTLIAAFASVFIIFILQMINASKNSANIVLAILFVIAFIYSAYNTYKTAKQLTTVGQIIGLVAYALVLFALCTFIFIQLAVWVMIIALVLFVIWLILKIAFPSKAKSKITVKYNDGTSEEMTEDGQGICGETYYKGEKGGTYVEP